MCKKFNLAVFVKYLIITSIVLCVPLIILSYYFSLSFLSTFVAIVALLAPGFALYHTDTKKKKKQFLYKLPEGKQFYSKIAEEYDSRNSKFLQESHRVIVSLITKHIKKNTLSDILDLGGGTGYSIAAPFFSNTKIHWHYVDASHGMKTLFDRNVESESFQHSSKNQDIDEFLNNCQNEFDVIILSFVLTSLEYKVNVDKLSKLLKPDGIIIIADIEPEYTLKKPEYSVILKNEIHSLKVSPTSSIDIISSALNANLKLINCQSVKRLNQERYAFILVFKHN